MPNLRFGLSENGFVGDQSVMNNRGLKVGKKEPGSRPFSGNIQKNTLLAGNSL